VAESGAMSPMELLQAWLDRACLTGADEDLPEGGMVTLMTVHNAKGLEYPAVFVVNMIEKQFPHARSMDDPKQIEEERRLAYVAFTRAMERLIITYSRSWTSPFQTARGGHRMHSEAAQPSRFLYSLPHSVCINGPPVEGPGAEDLDTTPVNAKLRTFLELQERGRSAPQTRAAPQDEYRVVELEHPDQLAPGVKVVHPQLGIGVVKGVRGAGSSTKALVSFGAHDPPVSLPLRNHVLRILVE